MQKKESGLYQTSYGYATQTGYGQPEGLVSPKTTTHGYATTKGVLNIIKNMTLNPDVRKFDKTNLNKFLNIKAATPM